jgi:hypothetical protein
VAPRMWLSTTSRISRRKFSPYLNSKVFIVNLSLSPNVTRRLVYYNVEIACLRRVDPVTRTRTRRRRDSSWDSSQFS